MKLATRKKTAMRLVRQQLAYEPSFAMIPECLRNWRTPIVLGLVAMTAVLMPRWRRLRMIR